MSNENNSSNKSKTLNVRVLLSVKATTSNWESWYSTFCAAASALGIAYDEFRQEERYDWEKAHKDLIAKYAEDAEPPLDKNAWDYQPIKSAVAKLRDDNEVYDKERRTLYSSLVASVDLTLIEDLRLTHKAQLQECTDKRDTIALLKLLRDHCSKNATQSIITQKKN
jgi:hypothetical protein